MARVYPFLALAYIGLLVFSLIDLVTIDNSRVRHLPKGAWICLIVLVPFVGPLLWLFVGRESAREGAVRASGSASTGHTTVPGRVRGPLAPDDDPEFLARLRREREQEERIRKLEQRLSELDDGDGAKGGPTPGGPAE